MKKSEIKKFNVLRQAGELIDGAIGEWIYDLWRDYDRMYFRNRLCPGGIQWGLTPHGKALGYYARSRNVILLHQSLLAASASGHGDPWGIGNTLGNKLAADVLLHEMVHQYLHQQQLPTLEQDPHQSQSWCDELNRLAPMLGVEQWYFTPWKRNKITIDLDPEIQGRYCDVISKQEHKKPTQRINIRVHKDDDAAALAAAFGKRLAPAHTNVLFPFALRPPGFYSEEEQKLVEETA